MPKYRSSKRLVIVQRRAHKSALNSKRIVGPINLFAISVALHVSVARIDRTPTLRISAVIRNETPMTARREEVVLVRGKGECKKAKVYYPGFSTEDSLINTNVLTIERDLTKYCFQKISTVTISFRSVYLLYA